MYMLWNICHQLLSVRKSGPVSDPDPLDGIQILYCDLNRIRPPSMVQFTFKQNFVFN